MPTRGSFNVLACPPTPDAAASQGHEGLSPSEAPSIKCTSYKAQLTPVCVRSLSSSILSHSPPQAAARERGLVTRFS